MLKQRVVRASRYLMLAVLIVAGGAGTALAESPTSKSSNYSVSQTQFGAGSTNQTCSSSYCSKTSIGDLSAGSSSSASSTASFGQITDSNPLLEVIVGAGITNLGNLAAETTATKSSTVQVRNYLSSGYVIQVTGSPPKIQGHTLATPATPTASAPGTEQFGINVTQNTTPSVGAAPVQVPSNTFSFGSVTDDYKQSNKFKYVSGDTVARSASSSGQTNYTLSFIVNIANNTPAGRYEGEYSAVVIPTY